MDLSMRQKQTHRHRDQTCKGTQRGEGRVGSLGSANARCDT